MFKDNEDEPVAYQSKQQGTDRRAIRPMTEFETAQMDEWVSDIPIVIGPAASLRKRQTQDVLQTLGAPDQGWERSGSRHAASVGSFPLRGATAALDNLGGPNVYTRPEGGVAGMEMGRRSDSGSRDCSIAAMGDLEAGYSVRTHCTVEGEESV